MPAKTGLTGQAQITNTTVREIDFVTRFTRNWNSLIKVLGIVRPIAKEAGTVLKAGEAKVTLADGAVGEGEEIPYSQATYKETKFEDLTLEKYVKAVSVEAVNKYGPAIAVEKTDDAFLNELQSNVMTKFYTFLQSGTLTDKQKTLQMAISMSIGRVKDKFKKLHRDCSEVVVFVNTLDVYEYLGSANITVQTANGVEYLKNFLGASTLILSSEIPQGKVIATPVENIVLYYIDPSTQFEKLGLVYTVEGETNLLGFHVEGSYRTAVGEAYALMGMKLWAEYLDGIAVVTVEKTISA